jgi:hypothetical protein
MKRLMRCNIRPIYSNGEEPKRLGRFEIDRELECCRGLNRQIGGVGAAEYFIDVGGRAPETGTNTGSIAISPPDSTTCFFAKSAARDEFLLAAAAQNLWKLAKLMAMPRIQPA